MKFLFDENLSPRLVGGLSDALLRSNRPGVLSFGAEAGGAFLAIS